MIIRELKAFEDIKEINRIYSEFYSNNEYPDFFNPLSKFHGTFAIIDAKSNKTVVVGGVKTIAEAVLLTDKGISPRIRIDALLQALGSVSFITKDMGFKEVHAFVNHDDKYTKALQRFGFRELDAKLLLLDVGEL